MINHVMYAEGEEEISEGLSINFIMASDINWNYFIIFNKKIDANAVRNVY